MNSSSNVTSSRIEAEIMGEFLSVDGNLIRQLREGERLGGEDGGK